MLGLRENSNGVRCRQGTSWAEVGGGLSDAAGIRASDLQCESARASSGRWLEHGKPVLGLLSQGRGEPTRHDVISSGHLWRALMLPASRRSRGYVGFLLRASLHAMVYTHKLQLQAAEAARLLDYIQSPSDCKSVAFSTVQDK